MDPVTHGLTGWLIATGLRADARTRTFAAVAAIAPDVDWAPILWGGDVLTPHRAVGHNVWVGVPLAAILAVRSGKRWRSAAAFYLAFLSHLAWDLTFVDWPEKLLWPLSQHAFPTLGWQPLSAQHLLSLGAVCACTVVVMIWTGFAPWELFHPSRLDIVIGRTVPTRGAKGAAPDKERSDQGAVSTRGRGAVSPNNARGQPGDPGA